MYQRLEDLYLMRHQNFQKRLLRNVYKKKIALEVNVAVTEDHIPFSERENLDYKKMAAGDTWGKAWDSAWLNINFSVPADWKGNPVALQICLGGEALVFSNEGVPLYGLTNKSVFDNNYTKDTYRLFDQCEGGEQMSIWVEAAANSIMGINRDREPEPDDPNLFGAYSAKIEKLNLCLFDEEQWQLSFDFHTLRELSLCKDLDQVRKERVLQNLNDCIEVFEKNNQNASMAREILAKELKKPANASAITIASVGHAHIDTGWLWRVKETVRKCARTFASQISLLEKYPDYVFGASQPQHYQFVKDHYPELYQKIKEKVKTGQWECQGAAWVEADCNVISGESMVRQIVHGKNFYKDEFDFDVKNLWIPDVFGYSASMPQIMKKSGVDYFLTQKISWSQFNDFPHTTFWWQGIDGSEVLTHFPPGNSYNGTMNANFLRSSQSNFRESGVHDEAICLFGIGNGGGGPQEDHVEKIKRLGNLESFPKVIHSRSDDFFERLNNNGSVFKKWVGELYLEYHRGTLTTQALVKKRNRQLELKMRELEMIWSAASLKEYPLAKFDAIWKKILINQFHDIIPGSSINEVYKDTHAEYEWALKECEQLKSDASDLLFESDENAIVIFNSLSEKYCGKVNLPDSWKGRGALLNGEAINVQETSIGLFIEVAIEGLGNITIEKSAISAVKTSVQNDLILENDLIKYEFNQLGQLISIYDKEIKREIAVSEEVGNKLSLYDDRPITYDAWDVEIYYEDMKVSGIESKKAEKVDGGSVCDILRFESIIGESLISQQVVLGKTSRRIDFITNVDWNENRKMLRVDFPVDLMNSKARFDIQYGFVERETHNNTSWDWAKFEVTAHKYADLSENNYGVALLNDCKYGYKVKGNTLDLCLLRSPKFPDPAADIGKHEFTYSLLPHTGDLISSNVINESKFLNQPPLVFENKKCQQMEIPCFIEGDGVSIEVIKKAEKEECIVVRLVEAFGSQSKIQLKLCSAISKVVETNLIEWEELSSTENSGSLELSFKPFEIRTFKLIK